MLGEGPSWWTQAAGVGTVGLGAGPSPQEGCLREGSF